MWGRLFFFCLLLCFYVPVAPCLEQWHPISEAELSRLEELSAARAQRSTQALASIKGLELTLARLKAKQAMLGETLSQARALTTKSRELYVEYVKGASSIIASKDSEIAALKVWKRIAFTLLAVVLAYIALKLILLRLKIP